MKSICVNCFPIKKCHNIVTLSLEHRYLCKNAWYSFLFFILFIKKYFKCLNRKYCISPVLFPYNTVTLKSICFTLKMKVRKQRKYQYISHGICWHVMRWRVYTLHYCVVHTLIHFLPEMLPLILISILTMNAVPSTCSCTSDDDCSSGGSDYCIKGECYEKKSQQQLLSNNNYCCC